MTVAADTRSAVRRHPFLYTALQAGVLNYTAAAKFLDVGETEAVSAALRRFADELDEYESTSPRVSVSMQSGVRRIENGIDDEAILTVGPDTFAPDGGNLTAIVATGDLDASALETVLGNLRTAGTTVVSAAGTDGRLAVVVDRRSAPDAVRALEASLENVQTTH